MFVILNAVLGDLDWKKFHLLPALVVLVKKHDRYLNTGLPKESWIWPWSYSVRLLFSYPAFANGTFLKFRLYQAIF